MGVQIANLDKVLARLKEVDERLNNKTDFKQKAALLVVAAAKDSHDQQGPGWQALDLDTVKKKGNSRILEDTGKGINTMYPVIGPDYVGVKYRQYYMNFHQQGKGQAQRPVQFTDRSKQVITEAAKKALGWNKPNS